MRRAKILATLGPSSSSQEVLEKMIWAGMNVARVNMSHGTHEQHRDTIQNLRKVSEKTRREVAIVLDLQGPKIRLGNINTPREVEGGDHFLLTSDQKKHPECILCDEPSVVPQLDIGQKVLIDDGKLIGEIVEKLSHEVVKIELKNAGTLRSRKGISFPGSKFLLKAFTEKDRKDLIFGLKEKVDYIALSFVNSANDVKEVKQLLHGLKSSVPIISKIERPGAIENLDEIISASDVILIARGDLGVELGNHRVPTLQKEVVKRCNEVGAPVIVATQMLESMIESPTPTRAEGTDVANAIWDGADILMLSGETAVGKYPVVVLETMNMIIEEAEKSPKVRPLLRNMELHSISASTQIAASVIAEKVGAKLIISVTQSGNSARKMSRFRSKVKVMGVTNKIEVVRRMTLYWGITPYLFNEDSSEMQSVEFQMIEHIRKKKLVEAGDRIVITRGDGKYFTRGTSNSLRVEIVKTNLSFDESPRENQIVKFNKGMIELDTNICSSCQSCISICPYGIWEHKKDSKKETRINEKAASHCTMDMECVISCPTGAIEITPLSDTDDE